MGWGRCTWGAAVLAGTLHAADAAPSPPQAQDDAPPPDPSTASTAEVEFERGWAQLEADDWTGACASFERSMQLEPAAGTQLRIAHCREHEGRLATAWYAFRRAIELGAELALTEARRLEIEEYATKELARLEPRVPRLRLRLAGRPRGMKVEHNGVVISAPKLDEPLLVDAGEHVFEAAAPGFHQARATVIAREGVTLEVPLALVPLTEAPSPRRRHRVAAPAQPDETQQAAGLVTGAVGLTALGVAAVLGVYTLARVAESSDGPCNADDFCSAEGIELREEAQRAQTAGLVMLAVGASALGAGVAVYLTATAEPRVAIRVRGPGAALEVRF